MVSSSETPDYPAPNLVGKEFVRQYYTLLHEAPQHLHRFYCNDSIFVRGKLVDNAWESEAIIGSTAIQKKLSEVNLENPYARIFTVESHKTLGDGVVVLVCGALRHGNSELRRFVQTFVLAPQSPKKYYVQNDIFQFVDDAFAYQVNNYPNDEEITTPPLSNGAVHMEELSGSEKIEPDMPKRDVEVVLGTDQHVDQVVPAANVRQSPSPVEMESYRHDHQNEGWKEQKENWPTTESDSGKVENLPESDQMESYAEPQAEDQDQVGPAKLTEKPSWAMLVKVGNQPVVTQPNNRGAPQQQQQTTPRPPTSGQELGENQPNGAPPGEVPPNQPPQQQRGEGRFHQGGQREFRTHLSSPGPCDYPDNQQLFIGRIPHNVNEQQLREAFSQYGTIVDLRIQRRPAGSTANFGFVAFENVEAVEKCRNNPPILPPNFRLNVEVKRPRGDSYHKNYQGGGRGGGGNFRGEQGQQHYPNNNYYNRGEGPYQQGPDGGFPHRDFRGRGGGGGGGNRGGVDQRGGMRGRNPNNPPFRGGPPPPMV